jgi:hypothetical protein
MRSTAHHRAERTLDNFTNVLTSFEKILGSVHVLRRTTI